MIRSLVRFACGVVVCLCASCSFHHGLEVVSTNFSDVISPQQNLVFRFNDDVVNDTLVNEWDTTSYVHFEPAMEGRYKWTAKNELSFTPAREFLPNTEYKMEITSAVLTKGTLKSSLGPDTKFSAHTPYVALEFCDASWVSVKERGGAIELAVRLHFNYPVSSESVSQLLHLKFNDKDMQFSTDENTVSADARFHIQQNVESIDEGTLYATVSAGVRCYGAKQVSTSDLSAQCEILSRRKLAILNCNPEFVDGVGIVHCSTSQPVQIAEGEKIINVVPAVANLQTEINEYGFDVKGNFEAGRQYTMSVSKSLRGVLGGSMSEDFIQSVNFGALNPELRWSSERGMYLSPKSSRNIGVNIIGINNVKVSIVKIYENNIQAFLRDARRYAYEDYGYGEGDETDGQREESSRYRIDFDYTLDYYKEYGNILSTREYAVKNLAKSGNISLLNLALDNIGEFKGIYVVRVESMDDSYRAISKLVSVSDIGLIVKKCEDDVYVFCNSIKSAESLSGVSMKFISTNNQTLQTATSDANGVVHFENVLKRAKDFEVGMVTATLGGDFNYMMFRDTRVETSRFDVGGLQENTAGLQAYCYGDRDIYRPGETIHLNTIVRDKQWNPVSKQMLKLRIASPDGREFRFMKIYPDAEGSVTTDIALSSSVLSGTYVVEILSANDVLLNSHTIAIEEFVPDRINVHLSMSKTAYSVGDSVAAFVNAMNYFGPPAVHRKAEFVFSVKRKDFRPKQFPQYDFSIRTKESRELLNQPQQTETDASGNASARFLIPKEAANTGLLEGSMFATVFDENGRPVHRLERFEVQSQSIFYGIKYSDSYTAVHSSVPVQLIAVDRNGNPQSVKARVQFLKRNWQTVLRKNDYGGFSYVSEMRMDTINDRIVSINGSATSLSVVPHSSGDYEVHVMSPDGQNYVSRSFWAWSWGSTSTTAFQVKKEGTIDISFDKARYTVGEKATVLFKTPFAGRLLVCVERNGLLSHQYINTDEKSASISINITDAMAPNVYVFATLFKPLDDGAMPLTVAHGVASLNCEPRNATFSLSIDAPDHARSNSKQTIRVKAANAGGAEVTIAVVDEGILAMRQTKTPNPHDYFYQKRALQVESFDLYPYIFPDLRPTRMSYGAGNDELSRRLSPVIGKRFNLVAFWSGIIKTNASGEASYTIDIPAFSGSLRVMAVAYKGRAFSSAEKNIVVADPLVVSSGLPRVMSPGDTVRVPLTVSNTTAKVMNVAATISTSGGVKVQGSTQQNLSIAAHSEQRALFTLVAQNSIGIAHIEMKASGSGESTIEKTDIAIRPSVPLQHVNGAGSVGANETKSFALMSSFISGTTKGKLVVSRSLVAEFGRHLDYLISYPHGCVEQTTSKAFPQLYIADLNNSLSQDEKQSASSNVDQAILKLQSMQLYNGALSYWQGDVIESWWGSIYAAHFLIEAKRNGHEVSSTVLDRLLQYIAKKAHMSDRRTYAYFGSDNVQHTRSIAPQEVFYSLYVLAQAGRQDVSLMNFYKTNLSVLTDDSRYLLANTFLYLGDRNSFEKVLPNQISQWSVNDGEGCWSSPIRDEALILSTLVDVDKQNPQIPVLVRHLTTLLRNQYYYSTQEDAFAIIALGKYARTVGAANGTASITVAGKKYELNGADVVVSDNVVGQNVSISARGGSVYYYWDVSGVPSNGEYKQEDSFLRVRRDFFDRNGREITANSFRQNDAVVVRITLDAIAKTSVSNVVITDILPAGLEIENPRLNAAPDMPWIKKTSIAQHTDFRDDRVNIFTNLNGTQTFYYVARAVSPGVFKLGPISAEAMYNGQMHSVHGGGVVKIAQ